MTVTNVTPTGDTNTAEAPAQAIDNMGNPVDDKGNPVDASQVKSEGEGETVESLQKALKDTKAELTKLQQEKAGKKAEKDEGNVTIHTDPKEAAKDSASKAVTDAGLDFGKYSDEINDGGKLSDESYAELAAKGFTKDIVDDYVAGQQARLDNQTKEVATVVGGEEHLDTVLSWAAENLSADEINLYNEAVAMGTPAAKLALRGIYAQFVEANGKNPNLINTTSSSTGSDIFKSANEMQLAMQDKRYWNDPDYQKEVSDKAARSYQAGTI